MAYPPPPPRRPIGVAILAILVILAGVVLTLLTGLLLLATIVVASGLFVAIALVLFLLSLFLLLAGIGLWKLRPWAWWLSVIVLVLTVITQLSSVGLSGLRSLSTGELIVIGIPILILIYLIAVRGHFRSTA